MPKKPINPGTLLPFPLEYAGKWVAWNSDHTQIVAAGESIQEVWNIVSERRIADPVYERIPRADVRLVGMR
ncbi:MAG: hypothetical protein U0992_03355 [Planctomycetaceae bacterium]